MIVLSTMQSGKRPLHLFLAEYPASMAEADTGHNGAGLLHDTEGRLRCVTIPVPSLGTSEGRRPNVDDERAENVPMARER